MKRTVFCVLIPLLLAALLCGCGAAPEPSPTPSPSPSPSPTPAPVTELTLSEGDPNAILEAAAEYPALRFLDLRPAELSAEGYDTVAEALPDCEILWSVPVCGACFDSGSSELDLRYLPDCTAEELLAALSRFSELKYADLRGRGLTYDEMVSLSDALPDARLLFSFTVAGLEADGETEELTFTGDSADAVAELTRYERFMPRLTYADLCACPVADGEMDGLLALRPDVKFVWTIVMSRWTLRTDALAFSTFNTPTPPSKLTSEDIEALRYCTDLVALDMGHNRIEDVSVIAGFKNLRILILADNRITDISPLAELSELRYLELFMNDVTDLAPLSGLDKLLDLNLGYCHHIEDFSPILEMDSLERIWLCATGVEGRDGQLDALKEKFPDAAFDVSYDSGSTAHGWREHERYFAMRDMFMNNYLNDLFA